ncbi:MAG: CHAT domain-containing protein [Gammaproteobacteria bacterium]|nr:CHAT domain-containing protein [Gammaproteobacteria bacterium]
MQILSASALIGVFFLLSPACADATAETTGKTDVTRSLEAGDRAFRAGKFIRAIEYWEQAQKQPVEQAKILTRQAEAYQRLGHYPQALERLRTALPLTKAADHGEEARAGVLAGLGNLCTLTTDIPVERCDADAPDSYVQTGLKLAKKAGNTELSALLHLARGNWHAALPAKKAQNHTRADRQKNAMRLQKTVQAYQTAADLAKAAGNLTLTVKALNNAVTVMPKKGAEAGNMFKQSLSYLAQLPDSHDKLLLLLDSGLLARSAVPAGDGYTLFNQALEIARRLDDKRGESFALGYLAQLYETRERYAEALQLTRQALAQQTADQELLLQWNRQSGRLFKAMDKPDEAIAAYYRAIWHLEEIRRELESCRGIGVGFHKAVRPVYLELADLLLLRAEKNENTRPAPCESLPTHAWGRTEEAARKCPSPRPFIGSGSACDLRNAQAAMERIKAAELRDYFQDPCVTKSRPCETAVEQLASAGTAIVYPVILPHRAAVLLYLPDEGWRQIRLAVTPGALREHVESLSKLIRTGSSAFYYKESAQWLYERLIRPLENDLTRHAIKTLVFVPDEHLRMLPVAVFHDDVSQKFLIEKYALAITPGTRLTDPVRMSQSRRLLVSGLSERHESPDYRGLPPLSYVREEVDFIKTLYQDQSTDLLNKVFVLDNLEKNLKKERNYSILHIASHSFFEREGKNTVILTSDDALNMNTLEKFIQDARKAGNDIEFLALSACTTAVDEEKAALGLAGIAVKAGVPGVLGTLWQVNDQAAALLIKHFYQLLRDKPDLSKAQVLQQAQLHLLTGNAGKEFQNPYYWAPFLLIGNWL